MIKLTQRTLKSWKSMLATSDLVFSEKLLLYIKATAYPGLAPLK